MEEFNVGDFVRIETKIKEAGRERIARFDGTVISLRGMGENKTFTVRKIATGGVGVERIWPLQGGAIVDLKVLKKGVASRAKLYYLRGRIGKEALKVKEKVSHETQATKGTKAAKAGNDKKTVSKVVKNAKDAKVKKNL